MIGFRPAIATLACLAAVAASWAIAAELDEIQSRGELVWAADQEGGGPHVFPDPSDPRRLVGFEVEFAELLAGELGVKARFQQGQWDRLPLLLDQTADCVINGIELTPERRRDYGCSRPYFGYALQMVGRRAAPPAMLADLAEAGPAGAWRVGVLTGSAAEIEMRARAARGEAQVEVIGYDGTLDSMEQVQSGVLDAAVLDDCIVTFYADRFAALRNVDRPFAGGLYTVLTSHRTPKLAAAIDGAIGRLIADGRLKKLYDRWDLAGRQQMLMLRDAAEIPVARGRTLGELVRQTLPLLLSSAGMTVLLSCAAFPLAVAAGLAVAVGRLHGPAWLRPLLTGYVEVLRGTPLMLQLYAIFFLLPKIGLALPALVAAIIGLALNYSAYESEIYRAGLKAVPLGQFEAALSLGLTKWQALRHVLVPQAVRIVMPPVTSDFIALFKDTSVCSAITVIELTKRYSVLALSTGRIVELAVVTAVLYLCMSWPLAVLSRWFESRLDRPAGGGQ
ncbi:MAG: ABC transporter substrate-binding protein/permease [Planctomycetes bacterium]|nr:ABC transporter substrate-binding protein/permease [Planctomycetota bacterium]